MDWDNFNYKIARYNEFVDAILGIPWWGWAFIASLLLVFGLIVGH